MKYKELSIKNFRGIESLEIKSIKDINILVGKNGCGKTSIIEAVFLLSGMSNPLIPQTINFLRELMITNNDDFKYIFHDFDFSNSVQLKGKLDKTKRVLNINPKYENPKYEEQLKKYEQNNEEIGKIKINSPMISTELKPSIGGININFESDGEKYSTDYSINKIYDPTLIKYKENLICNYIYPKFPLASVKSIIEKLTEQKKLDRLITVLKEIEPRVSDIRIAVGGLIYVDMGFNNLVPLNLLGDGIIKILTIISIMFQSENGILLIDEIENGLYYTSLYILWKAILKSAKEFNVQVFTTTHSYECIKDLLKIYSEDKMDNLAINLYRIRKHDNKHEVYPLDADAIKTGIESDLEVR